MSDGAITITRPDCGGGEVFVKIVIKTAEDRIALKLTPKQFTLALTGRTETACAVQFRKRKGE